MTELKTPLYETHLKYGGKIVPFAGYLLPVQYQAGVIAEHMAVRERVGVFDVSHMGEILLQGTDALANLHKILTNDFTNMVDGQARYSIMCYEDGGTVDDLIVYKRGENDYFIVVNAANKDKDFAWMKQHEFGDAHFTDISATVAQIAVQGPAAWRVLEKLTSPEFFPKKYYHAVFNAEIQGMPCTISKTGYTGEDGCEIYCANDDAPRLWDMLMEAGKDEGIAPCGLGCRDTLRLEAGMPLYGHEMDATVTPLEAGLGLGVKMAKPDFIGKKAMEAPAQRKRVGLKVTGRGIVREHETLVNAEGRQVGHTTSGTYAPFLKTAIAMALVENDSAELGTELFADVRGRQVAVEVIPLPFYKRPR